MAGQAGSIQARIYVCSVSGVTVKRGNDDFSLPPSFGESEPCKLSLQVYVKPFPALQRIYRNASRAVPERMNDRISLYHRS